MSDEADAVFDRLAATALSRIESALEQAGLDFDLPAGGVIEIEFDDGSKIVVNRHGPAREIWVAARSGGFHFRQDGDRWRDTRSGEDLFGMLARLVRAQSGRDLLF